MNVYGVKCQWLIDENMWNEVVAMNSLEYISRIKMELIRVS